MCIIYTQLTSEQLPALGAACTAVYCIPPQLQEQDLCYSSAGAFVNLAYQFAAAIHLMEPKHSHSSITADPSSLTD